MLLFPFFDSLSLSLTPNRYMTRRLALNLIALGWLVGLTIAAIPLIWNKWEYAQECEFDEIFYPWYMVGVITPIFSLVWLVMLFVYCRIWREASKQVKQLRTQGQQEGSDWKSVQVSSKISNWIFFSSFFRQSLQNEIVLLFSVARPDCMHENCILTRFQHMEYERFERMYARKKL